MTHLWNMYNRLGDVFRGRSVDAKPTGLPSGRFWPALARSSASATPQERIAPSSFDKFCLVKAKTYASKEAIPETVSHNTLKRARDFMRIRVSLWMMGATTVGCIIMVVLGKRDRDEGRTLSKDGLEKIRLLREKGLQEEKDRLAAAAAHADK